MVKSTCAIGNLKFKNAYAGNNNDSLIVNKQR